MVDVSRAVTTPADRPLYTRIGTVVYVAVILAAMRFCGSMVPDRRGFLGYLVGCAFGLVLTVGLPALILKMWQASPAMFARWLFWSVLLFTPAGIAACLYLSR